MKDRIKDGYLVDAFSGNAVHKILDENDGSKSYAGFVQCGHCGSGYYMPAILTATCRNIDAAKEIITNCGRVKKGRKGVIMDIFEITQTEAEYILEVNYWHDPYFQRNFADVFDQRNEFIRDRRVIHKQVVEQMMAEHNNIEEFPMECRTQDQYTRLSNAFEKNFAPIIENGKLVFPDVDRNKAMRDFYRTTFRRYGLNKCNPAILAYYYIMFGRDNEYNFHIEDNYICYSYYNKEGHLTHSMTELPEVIFKKVIKAKEEGRIGEIKSKYAVRTSNDPARKLLNEIEVDYRSDNQGRSQTDKFKERMKKTAQLKEKFSSSQTGDELGDA